MTVEKLAELVRANSNGSLSGVSDPLVVAMTVVMGLIIIASLFALIISILLAISYVKYNHRQNSLGKTGQEIARQVLDEHQLEKIKVSSSGSILFGNSYSHFFKKVRLRRLTWKKSSLSSLAMAVQKPCLAILDRDGDPDMKRRVRLTPIIYLGPWALIPLILVGALLDLYVFTTSQGVCTLVFTLLALAFYAVSFVLSIQVLKTEKKAQRMALELMEREGYATAEETAMCKKLFRLYNIEYVNNMIIALLELIYRVLQLFAYIQNGSDN